MKLQVLYFEGCPNHQPTIELVRQVVSDSGLPVEVEEVEVRDTDDAERLRFLGSPTVQLDGRDIDPKAAQGSYSFSCRMYGPSGIPPKEMIEAALQSRID